MTAAAAVYIPSASVQASMRAHLDRRGQWVYCRVDGKAIIVMPSSTGKRVYFVGQQGECCTCEGARRYPICSHQWAAREAATVDNLSEYLADAADRMMDEYDVEYRFATCLMCNANRTLDAVMSGTPCPCRAARTARSGYAALFGSDDE